MKKQILALLLLAVAYCLPAAAQGGSSDNQITLLSYNVRNSGMKDGDHLWPKRRHATIQLLATERPDVVGLQEGLADQIQFIETECPQYGYVGVGRDDGDKQGEMMAVYYLRERFELLDSGTIWLSETPAKVSRGWDGACNRTMTWVKLQDRASQKIFFFFNTHLDHKGKIAREESIKLIVREIERIAGKKYPVVVGGDFNSPIDNPIYKPLQKTMIDARAKAPQSDNKGTFNGFGSAPDTIVIDHIFFRGAMKCSAFRTYDDNYGAPFISDHYPIGITFTLK